MKFDTFRRRCFTMNILLKDMVDEDFSFNMGFREMLALPISKKKRISNRR